MSESRIIVALDFAQRDQALELARQLDPATCRLKVGLELFVSTGPGIVSELMDMGYEIFLDLKFHDIPHTVTRACHAAASLGVWMLNVHALGGERILQAAREAVDQSNKHCRLIAVTLLTSHGEDELKAIGLSQTPEEQVQTLAQLAQTAGFDGIVCSPQEASAMRGHFGPDFLLVTPGVRPVGSPAQDQRRTLTPAQALAAGSDYLVIGRPITEAKDAAAALRHIQKEIDDG